MPLTEKGETIKKALQEEYGAEKGERILYAGKNAGTFTGIDQEPLPMTTTTVPDNEPEFHHEMPAADALNAPLVMPPVPEPTGEHPQLHPDASSPPTPALPGKAADGWGGIAGGVNPQGCFGTERWDCGDHGKAHDIAVMPMNFPGGPPGESLDQILGEALNLNASGVMPTLGPLPTVHSVDEEK